MPSNSSCPVCKTNLTRLDSNAARKRFYARLAGFGFGVLLYTFLLIIVVLAFDLSLHGDAAGTDIGRLLLLFSPHLALIGWGVVGIQRAKQPPCQCPSCGNQSRQPTKCPFCGDRTHRLPDEGESRYLTRLVIVVGVLTGFLAWVMFSEVSAAPWLFWHLTFGIIGLIMYLRIKPENSKTCLQCGYEEGETRPAGRALQTAAQ